MNTFRLKVLIKLFYYKILGDVFASYWNFLIRTRRRQRLRKCNRALLKAKFVLHLDGCVPTFLTKNLGARQFLELLKTLSNAKKAVHLFLTHISFAEDQVPVYVHLHNFLFQPHFVMLFELVCQFERFSQNRSDAGVNWFQVRICRCIVVSSIVEAVHARAQGAFFSLKIKFILCMAK